MTSGSPCKLDSAFCGLFGHNIFPLSGIARFSRFTYPVPVLDSVIFLRSPNIFHYEMLLQTKILMLSVLPDMGVSLLLILQWAKQWNFCTCKYTHTYIYMHKHIHILEIVSLHRYLLFILQSYFLPFLIPYLYVLCSSVKLTLSVFVQSSNTSKLVSECQCPYPTVKQLYQKRKRFN